jgi:hypothetical protein
MALTDAGTGALILDAELCREITLADSCRKGDALGYSTGWKRALATTGTAIQIKCVALMDGKTGDKISASFGKTRIGGRFSAGTVGGQVYVGEGAAGETTKGRYTESAPATGGDCNKMCGSIISATEIMVDPNVNVDSVG